MITTLFGVFRGNHECLAQLMNARESFGQVPFFHRTTQKQINATKWIRFIHSHFEIEKSNEINSSQNITKHQYNKVVLLIPDY